jgi:hypothetical protein
MAKRDEKKRYWDQNERGIDYWGIFDATDVA